MNSIHSLPLLVLVACGSGDPAPAVVPPAGGLDAGGPPPPAPPGQAAAPLVFPEACEDGEGLLHSVRFAVSSARGRGDAGTIEDLRVSLSEHASRCDRDPFVHLALGELLLELTSIGNDQLQNPRSPDEAQAELERARALAPENPMVIAAQAHCAEQRGDWAIAAEHDRALLALVPGDASARSHLGRSLLKLGRLDEAEAELRHVLEHDDGSAGPNLMLSTRELLAKVYMARGERERAERVLLAELQATALRSDAGGGHSLIACPYIALGRLYAETGREEESLEMVRQAAELEPEKPLLQYQAAVACYAVGELDCALRFADRAKAQARDDRAELLRAAILRAQRLDASDGMILASGGAAEEFEAALEAFDRHDFEGADAYLTRARGMQAAPEHAVLAAFLRVLERRYGDAEAELAQVAQDESTWLGSEVVRAHIDVARQQHQQAEGRLRPIIESVVADLERAAAGGEPVTRYQHLVWEMASLAMAWTLSNQERHVDALDFYDQALFGDPDDLWGLIGKANSLAAMGYLGLAEELLEQALALDPDNAYATAELALVHYNLHDDARAEELFSKAKAIHPEGYTCPWEGLGLVYLRQGRQDAAEEAFSRAIEIDPDIEHEKYKGLARIRMDQGRLDEARELLDKCLENHPQDETARVMLSELERRGVEAGR